ncbi:MAG: hypothetical protein ACQ9CV_08335 [Nitrosopumilus sp.]
MNTKTILGISLAAVFAVSIIGTAYANPTWLGLSEIGVEEKKIPQNSLVSQQMMFQEEQMTLEALHGSMQVVQTLQLL